MKKTLILVMLLSILLLFVIAPVNAQMTPEQAAERAVLEALYNSTDGDNWFNNTGWLSDAFPSPAHCSWHGVFCDADGRVNSIGLGSNNLSGPLPAEIGTLSHLESLSMSYNEISGEIPKELGNLSHLVWIDIWANNLNGTIPPELGNLSNLQVLGIQVNKLEGSIPKELGQLSNLEILYLDRNRLTGTIPKELGNLNNLTGLFLFDNQLIGSIPSNLANLNNLQYLLLRQNQLNCWESQSVLDWAGKLFYIEWDYPYPGQVICPENLVGNGDFEQGTKKWNFYSNGSGDFATAGDPFNGQLAANVRIEQVGSNMQLYQKEIPLEPHQVYRLYFAAKSSNGVNLRVFLHKHDPPYTNYGLDQYLDLGTDWQTYTVEFTTRGFNDPINDARLRFWFLPFAEDGVTYNFDYIFLEKLGPGTPPVPPPDPQPPQPDRERCSIDAANVISNPGFEALKNKWSFYTNGSGSFNIVSWPNNFSCEKGARIATDNPGSNIQLYQKNVPLQPRTRYVLQFVARSNSGHDVQLFLHKHDAPYTSYGLNGVVIDLKSEWQLFKVYFSSNGFNTPITDARLRFWFAPFAKSGDQYFFDDVSLMTDNEAAQSTGPDMVTLFATSGMSKDPLPTNTTLVSGYFIDNDEQGRLDGAPVAENQTPICTGAKPNVNVLWPANGKFKTINIKDVSDIDGEKIQITIDSIFQDEPVGRDPDGRILRQGAAQIRAERARGGNGRVYRIAFTATDPQGATCSSYVLVHVPPSKDSMAVDDGPQFNSTE